VDAVERSGPQTFLHLTLAGQRCSALADQGNRAAPGDRVHVGVDGTAVRFFTADGHAL
jgi:ABC-type sugar transport system ATPase subunit